MYILFLAYFKQVSIKLTVCVALRSLLSNCNFTTHLIVWNAMDKHILNIEVFILLWQQQPLSWDLLEQFQIF